MRIPLVICVILGCITLQVFAASDKIFCYFGSWAVERKGNAEFRPEDINPNLCTHVIYSGIGLNADATIKILSHTNDIENNGFKRFTGLKELNPNLKTLITIGGWEKTENFSAVAKSKLYRTNMASNVVEFCKKYGFDGLDISWEYHKLGNDFNTDKEFYVELLKKLQEKFKKEKFILTAAIGLSPSEIDNTYDIPQVSKSVDYALFITYDLRGPWENVTGENSPLYQSEKEDFNDLNINATITKWISHGGDPKKTVVGIPFFGHSFTLCDASNNTIGSRTCGSGQPGNLLNTSGTLIYPEICEAFRQGGWTKMWNEDQKVPYAFKGDQWIGYDDRESIQHKLDYVKLKNLAGVVVWSIDLDDFRGTCGEGKYPLMNTIHNGLIEPPSSKAIKMSFRISLFLMALFYLLF